MDPLLLCYLLMPFHSSISSKLCITLMTVLRVLTAVNALISLQSSYMIYDITIIWMFSGRNVFKTHQITHNTQLLHTYEEN